MMKNTTKCICLKENFNVQLNSREQEIITNAYKCVEVVKRAVNAQSILVLNVSEAKKENSRLVTYDLDKRKELFELPISSGFIDLAIMENHTAFLLCDEEKNTSRYGDEDDYSVLFWAHFSYDEVGNTEMIGKVTMDASYDNYDEKWLEIRRYSNNMKIPLLDQFLKNYPQSKCLSKSGRHIVFYCEDFNGVIVGDYATGDVHRMFELPEKAVDKRSQFYYDDTTEELLIMKSPGSEIKQYKVITSKDTEDVIWKLNESYNSHFKQKQTARNSFEFQKLFHKVLDICWCEEMN